MRRRRPASSAPGAAITRGLLRENIDDPILKPAGVTVIQDVGDETPRYAKMAAQQDAAARHDGHRLPGAVNGYRATEAGLLEPLDETKVPNLKHVLPNLRATGFVPHIYSAQVIVHNPAT